MNTKPEAHARPSPSGAVRRIARRLMREQFEIIPANESGVIAGGVDPLHDIRVAIRRLRTLLRVFSPVCGGQAALLLEKRLNRLQKALGPARDADVLIGILQSRSTNRIFESLKARNKIIERQHVLVKQRKEAVRILLNGATYRRLMNDTAGFLDARRPRGKAPTPDLRTWADTAIQQALARVERRAAMPTTCPADAIHRLRIACRRARYLCEFFAADLGRKTLTLGQHLKDAQDVLGDIHDLDVLLAELDREHVKIPAKLFTALERRRKKLVRQWKKASRPFLHATRRNAPIHSP